MGSDPIGVLHHASSIMSQHQGVPRHVYIWTDGLQTEDLDLRHVDLTSSSAVSVAEQVDAPALDEDITLTVAGIGRTAGDPLPSSYTEGLLTFWSEICDSTGAADCVVTDQLSLTTNTDPMEVTR